jgi:hypothetical protein
LKHSGAQNTCGMTFSDSELFRQHYVALEGPIRSTTKDEPGIKQTRKTRSNPRKRKRNRQSSESESAASSVDYRPSQRRARSSTSSYVGEDEKLMAMEQSARRSAAPSRHPESESEDDYYPLQKLPDSTIEAVTAIMQYHAGPPKHVAPEFDVEKTHRIPEWREHVMQLRDTIANVNGNNHQLQLEKDALQKQLEHLQQYYHSLPKYEQELIQARTEHAQLSRDYQMLRLSFDDMQKQLREAQSEVRRAYLTKFDHEEEKLQVPVPGPIRGSSPHRLGEFFAANYHFSPNTAYLALSEPAETSVHEAGAWDALH